MHLQVTAVRNTSYSEDLCCHNFPTETYRPSSNGRVTKAIHSRWGHHGLCTPGQQSTQRSGSFEFITRFAFVTHWSEGEAIAVGQLPENLAGRADLPAENCLPRRLKMCFQVLFQLVIVSIRMFIGYRLPLNLSKERFACHWLPLQPSRALEYHHPLR